MLPSPTYLISSTVLCVAAAVAPTPCLTAQSHEHGHSHHAASANENGTGSLVTIEQVLEMQQNQQVVAHAGTGAIKASSGDGDLSFDVLVTSKALPKEVFDENPFAKKRKILDCAHGGFAFDHRLGKGEVYWFLQGAGAMRIHTDRSKIELLATDPKMVKFNMHNATFFEHKGEGRIAWPANGGASVFVTDVDGKLLHTIGRPTMKPYSDGAGYAPTDTAYLDGKLWVTDGYASKFVMSYDLDKEDWTGTIFGGRSKKAEPGKFGTNHGITIHKGLIYVSGRYFARIHTYKPSTEFVSMFPLPEGSKPCDFEFFKQGGKLYGVAASLNKANGSKDTGAAIYIVDMETLKIVSTIKPKDELGLSRFTHLHNVFPCVEDGVVTLFCQAWNVGDFAVLRQVAPQKQEAKKQAKK
tara:strand:+ start:2791 stop:4023 length:1233 start_codon:yes stop_codon:yes gene_type:complete